ncbi:MAG: type IV secretion protein Rhs [Phototrophicales bacterium]|nr:MAG: type IV secretion protein Rhs [Phototrophicales bacterium]
MAIHNEVRIYNPYVKVNGTDLKPEVISDLIDIVVESSLHLPAMAVVRLNDRELKHTDDESLFPLGATLEIEVSPPDNPQGAEKIFKGEIIGIEPMFEEGAIGRLVIRAYDKSHRMHRGTKTRTFLNQKDSDIAQAIASEYGLSPVVDSTSQVYDHIYQDAISDMAFLQQRAARIGYEVFVDEEKLYFRKPDPKGPVATLEYGTDLAYFRPRLSIADQVDTVKVRGWNIKEKKAILGQASSSKTSPEIGISGWGGSKAQSALSAATEIETRYIVYSQADANDVATAILNDLNSGYIEADGEAFGNPKLKAGATIQIEKLGTRFSGKYKLTTVRHVLSPGHYVCYFTVEGRNPRTLTQLLKRSNGNERWSGVVPAIVTNNEDPEQMGRVKVKYPWLDEQQESWWARVVTMGGGGTRGFYILPEVGDEVLVAFEQGDVNQPYVIGNLYNGKDKPPAQTVASGKVKERLIQTRTGHKIRMVDEDSGDDFIEIIDAHGHTSIKFDAASQKIILNSTGDIELTSKGTIKMSATRNIQMEARGSVSVKGTQNVDVEGTTGVSVKTNANLNLTATGQASLEGSASTKVASSGLMNIQSGGVMTIQGTLVKIN